MKRFLTVFAIAASAIFALTSCQEDNPQNVDGPVITWASNPNFEPQDITNDMDVKISVSAPAGISTFVVTITSDALEGLLGTNTIDFINPASAELGAIVTMILGEGASVEGATELNLDLSNMIPLILGATTEESDHVFSLAVSDANGKSATAECTFHRLAENGGSSENVQLELSDVDLWKNTAVLTLTGGEAASVAYREQGTETWISLTAGTDGTYAIAPEWTKDTNAGGHDVYTPTAGTGIWAGKTYEFQVDGNAVEYTYTAADGDVIPNGDMSGWSTVSRNGLVGSADVAYPNAADAEAFWDCGNNGVTTTLCTNLTDEDGTALNVAALASTNMFVLAAGNLYTGDFQYASFTGTASFGKKYSFTARPRALGLKYSAVVGNVDLLRSSGDLVEGVAKGDPDRARIYVAIVDWTVQHVVESGMTTTTGSWDPANGMTQEAVTEGNIIGYGSFEMTAPVTGTADDLKDLTIDIVWYDTDAQPQEGNYSVVISCACNYYGDFFTGCSTNKLWVDDFAWVY